MQIKLHILLSFCFYFKEIISQVLQNLAELITSLSNTLTFFANN